MFAFNQDILNPVQLTWLTSIVQVAEATYRELLEDKNIILSHPYLMSERGRLRTKLAQMQCEIESHEPKFPFDFSQKSFRFGHVIPELRTKGLILHIGRSRNSDTLPPAANYKKKLSNNNRPLCRQLVFNPNYEPAVIAEPFYGLLAFGGEDETFIRIHFPEPGYQEIAETIVVPNIWISKNEETVQFERKKAVLKKEFLEVGLEEA